MIVKHKPQEAVSDDIFEDEPKKVSEPKKVVKKAAPAKKDDADLASVIDQWDD